MLKLLPVALVLTAQGARGSGALEDMITLIQSRTVSAGPPGPRNFQVGDRVMLDGFEDTMHNITVVANGNTLNRYNLVMEGFGLMRDVKEDFMHHFTVKNPTLDDPAAGPVLFVKGFEYAAKPRIVARGEQPGTWDIHVEGHGVVKNVDDGSLVREKSWYRTSSTTPPSRHGLASLEFRKWVSTPGPQRAASTTRAPAATTPSPEEQLLAVQAEQLRAAKAADAETAKMAADLEKIAAAAQAAAAAATATLEEEPSQRPATPPEPAPEAAAAAPEAGPERQAVAPTKASEGRVPAGHTSLRLEVPSAGGPGFVATVTKGVNTIKETELLIDSIDPNGPLAAWNAANRQRRISVGDRIHAINGHGGNANFLLKELKTKGRGGSGLELRVEHKSKLEGIKTTAVNAVNEIMRVGARGYLQEVVPMGLGKLLINDKGDVNKCADISSSLLCFQSEKLYSIKCAGWSGASCISKQDVKCGNLKTAPICNDAMNKFNITCAGWGGSSCLGINSNPQKITDPEICMSAWKRLGIQAAGWGGSTCLSPKSKCKEITRPGICNSAQARLNLTCLGWGGSTCLGRGASARNITTRELCKGAKHKFGIKAAGWSGSACLSRDELRCGAITDPAICSNSERWLNISCAGWGGSSCLDHGAAVHLISSPSICAKSKSFLGIDSAGWSGSGCMKPGPVSCSNITTAGVCNDARRRLGIDCAGWSGKQCIAREEARCDKFSIMQLCQSAGSKLGVKCVWNGDLCLPDTR